MNKKARLILRDLCLQHIHNLAEEEKEKIRASLLKDKDAIISLEKQLEMHNSALEKFMKEHYAQVSETLQRYE